MDSFWPRFKKFFVRYEEIGFGIERITEWWKRRRNFGTGVKVENDFTSGDYLHGFLPGTRKALYENERDSITITIPPVDAFSAGALIALYDGAVGFYARS